MAQFAGKVALVTGGGSGIGRDCALGFAREGARVVVADVDAAGGEETVRLAGAAGGEARFIRCDVSSGTEVEALIGGTVEAWGRLDCAVNNAGIAGAQAPVADYPDDAWRRVIDINLNGVWLCMKREIPPMLAGGGGAIVNVASILGLVGFANASAYVAAKHGVVGLTKTAAIEYAARGLRVNAVCPGFIETPMIERGLADAPPRVLQAITRLHPVGRLGRPEEIAAMVVWLCSDAASFVNGAAMTVDGGYVAQ